MSPPSSVSPERLEARQYCHSPWHYPHRQVPDTRVWVPGECLHFECVRLLCESCEDVLYKFKYLHFFLPSFPPSFLPSFLPPFLPSGKRSEAVHGWLWKHHERSQCQGNSEQCICSVLRRILALDLVRAFSLSDFFSVTSNRITKSHHHLLLSPDIPVPAVTRSGVLPQEEGPSQRPQTPEPAHQWKRRAQTSRLWYVTP